MPVINDPTILNKDEKKIVESLNHRNLSVSELSQTTNFSKSKVLYVTRDLIDKGIVKIIGNGRGTRYGLL